MTDLPQVIFKKKVDWTKYPAKGVTSALIITPPEHLWVQIQKIRRNHDKAFDRWMPHMKLLYPFEHLPVCFKKNIGEEIKYNEPEKHDKAFDRWMPHINLLYPFVLEPEIGFHKEAVQIKQALLKNQVPPFEVKFGKDSFGYFQHGAKCVVWLKPIVVQQTNKDNQKASPVQEKVGSPPRLKVKDNKSFAKSSVATTVRPVLPNSMTDTKKEEPLLIYPTTNSMIDSHMQILVENIKIVEPVIDYNPYRNVTITHASISSLHKAVWKEEDVINERTKPSSMEPGLDCLRYAVWSEDDNKKLDNPETHSTKDKSKHNRKKEKHESNKSLQNHTSQIISGSKYAALENASCDLECEQIDNNVKTRQSCRRENEYNDKSVHGFRSENTDHEKSGDDLGNANIDHGYPHHVSDVQCTNPYTFNYGPSYEEDFNQDDDGWETVKAKPKSIPRTNDAVNELAPDRKSAQAKFKNDFKAVENLQNILFETFPFCNDLNKKSKFNDGFKPHLTLGQCDSDDVESFIEGLKSKWKEIRFTVGSVYIINRRGKVPFEIREEIKFTD